MPLDKNWFKLFKPKEAEKWAYYFGDEELDALEAYEWKKYFKDLDEAVAWRELFNEPEVAYEWSLYFEDPIDAYEWYQFFDEPDVASELSKDFKNPSKAFDFYKKRK